MRDEPADAPSEADPGDPMRAAIAQARICPFLRAGTEDGSIGDPIPRPDPANRCVALDDAAAQSLRQQEQACLVSAHVNCPRYWRGALVMLEPMPVPRSGGLQPTPAIAGALLVLAASFALSVGFVVANGGLDLPVTMVGSAQAALETPGPGTPASPQPTIAPAPTEVASPSPAPSVAATPSPEPAATQSPEPAATPTPSPQSTAGPTSDRYALLEPCADAPDCWIYVVREGDNLVSIARYFGIPFKVVTDMNPWTETTQLVASQELRLPPPTR